MGVEGAKYIAEGLKENKALKELMYAAAHPFPYCQHPLICYHKKNWRRLRIKVACKSL